MGDRASKITIGNALSVFEGAAGPGTPLTTREVADELGCVRRTAYSKLKTLADRGELQTKKVGARGRSGGKLPLDLQSSNKTKHPD